MSAGTVARWNAIPMTRDADAHTKKRTRSDAEDEPMDDGSEDNVSLVSRSPSPVSEKDVEMEDINLYDEHVRKPAREVITVETKIKSSNKGFALLAKMGWAEGTPLGVSGEGRVDPIPFSVKQDQTGLGKVTQDFRMIETTVSQRRKIDSERMQFETADQRHQREAAVAQKAQVQDEISTVLRPFYCELCDKQFKNVAQYDEHTNSYAHHHKVRMKDMKANHPMKIGGKEEAEKRKEKERKREEKEMRKLAKAAGIKLAPAPTVSSVKPPGEQENKGLQKSGWATVSSSTGPTASAGWSTVSSPPAPSSGRWSTVSTTASSSTPRGSGWQPVASSSQPSPPRPSEPPVPPAPSHTPSFRSSGWSTLTSSTGDIQDATPPPPPPSRGGWASVSEPAVASSLLPPPPPPSWAPAAPPIPSLPSLGHGQFHPPSPAGPPPPSSNNWSPISPPPDSYPSRGGPPPLSHPLPYDARPPSPSGSSTWQNRQNLPKPKPADHDRSAESRGSWQQFQKMRGRR